MGIAVSGMAGDSQGIGAGRRGVLPVINPATEEVLSKCPRASKAQLDAAVAAAQRAFPGWRDTSIAERKAKLTAIADIIQAIAAELGLLLTQEQG